jgi:hypothetical protein
MALNFLLPDLKLNIFCLLDSKDLYALRSISRDFHLASKYFRPLYDELFPLILREKSSEDEAKSPMPCDPNDAHTEFPVDYFHSFARLRACLRGDVVKAWPGRRLLLHATPLRKTQATSRKRARCWRMVLLHGTGECLEASFFAGGHENVDICFLVYALNRTVVDHTVQLGARRNVAFDLHYQHGAGWRHWRDGMRRVLVLGGIWLFVCFLFFCLFVCLFVCFLMNPIS